MTRPHDRIWALSMLFCATYFSAPVHAATQVVFFDALNASTSVTTPLNAGDTLFVNTAVRQSGALVQTVTFTIGAGVTGLSGRVAWAISTAAGPGPRLIGANFDLFNAGNVLVASDAFQGTLSGFARSTFNADGLVPGTYRLVATGTGVRDSRVDLALDFTGAPPAVPATDGGNVPLQGPSTNSKTAFFNFLQDNRAIAPILETGNTLLVDTLVTLEAGALAQSVAFTLGSGIDRVIADLSWMISEATGSGPRLVAVNVDLVAPDNTVLLSDTLTGTVAGFAAATLNGAIAPGSYRLVITGTGVRDSSLTIALTGIDDEALFSNGFE